VRTALGSTEGSMNKLLIIAVLHSQLYLVQAATGPCAAPPTLADGTMSCTKAGSGSTYLEGAKCTFTCNKGYALGSVWSWSRYAGEGRYGGTAIGTNMYGGAEGPPQHPQMYNFRSLNDGRYEPGSRIALNQVSERTCQADGKWSGKPAICWKNTSGPCVHSVFPKCGPRTSQISPETRVTILGQRFDEGPVEVIFNDRNKLKSGSLRSVKSTEIIVAIPSYPEYNEVEYPHGTYDSRDRIPYPVHERMNKTSKGTVQVKISGVVAYDCRDVDMAHARRVFPFTYAVGWPANPPLYASDYAHNRIVEIDPDTGITVTRIDNTDGFPISKPYGLDIGPDGALYVAIAKPSMILRYNITGQFLGIWGHVPGEPRGIRWLDDQLYVCSWHTGRVLYFRHHAARADFNKPDREFEHNVGSFRGPFTQAMSSEITDAAKLTKPYELRFHSISGKRKLFVSSADNGQIFQFDGFTGAYEKILTSVQIPTASGFAFSFSKFGNDLFATGFHNGRAITRFNGTSGSFIYHFKDQDLSFPGGVVAHDDSIYVTSLSEVRQYSISTGRMIRISTRLEGAKFNFVTIAGQCN